MIGDREFVFVEDETILFMEGPIDPQSHRNTPDGCNTCGEKWKKASDLTGSHCDFCGFSNCKKCLRKERNFQRPTASNQRVALDKSGREKLLRGKICKVCDRKFFVSQMVQGTLKDIKTHNTVLASALTQQENFKREIQEVKDVHESKATVKKQEIKTSKQEIHQLEQDIQELKTSADDFENEIESGQTKQRMIHDQLENLKQNIDELDGDIGLKLLKLKEI